MRTSFRWDQCGSELFQGDEADDSARITLAEAAVMSSRGTEQQVGAHDPATSDTPTTVLSVGLHPSAIDYGRYPGLDEATMTARIDAGDAALRAAGFDFVPCRVPATPDEAEAVVRDCARSRPFGVVMIGAGVRMVPEHRAVRAAGQRDQRSRAWYLVLL